MPTMNIQISLKCHAVCTASKVLQNYNDLGLKEIGARPAACMTLGYVHICVGVGHSCSNASNE